jgi:hypothetical protein
MEPTHADLNAGVMSSDGTDSLTRTLVCHRSIHPLPRDGTDSLTRTLVCHRSIHPLPRDGTDSLTRFLCVAGRSIRYREMVLTR